MLSCDKCAMKSIQICVIFSVFAVMFNICTCIYAANSSLEDEHNDNSEIGIKSGDGVWGPMLEEWVLANHRGKRVIHIPITENDVLTIKRIDENETEKRGEKQGKTTPGKIVTNNNQPPNRIPTKPSGTHVSETDLYLLGAIEKLVYKVDFMEKRLRRVEEMLYYVMAGNRIDHEPCPNNFTRIGSNCYFLSSSAGREYDWKAASKQCKIIGAVLAEMETIEENQDIVAHIQSKPHLRGKDFWTGGLNPGLLWIWSNSARPVSDGTSQDKDKNKKPTTTILGNGRCLRLAYNPALRSYAYRGSDCGARYSYICEIQETTASNELRRLGRSRKILSDEL